MPPTTKTATTPCGECDRLRAGNDQLAAALRQLVADWESIDPNTCVPDEINTDEHWEAARAALAVAGVPPANASLEEVEKAHVLAVLRRCGGDKRAAAATLGISLKTLYNRLNAWSA